MKETQNTFPPSTLFYLLLLSGSGECGNGVCGQSIALHLRRSFLVTLFPCSNMGSFQRDAVLPKLILSGLHIGSSSSRTAPDMGPYHKVHPSGALCSNLGPTQVAASARSPAPAWAPLHSLLLRPGICSDGGLPQAAASFSASPPAPPWSPP